MSGDIKPIETRYAGYKFRSRLEARWAVFMDELGVPYAYEPEGYDLGDAGWYLPDFWLPRQECWVEVKPILCDLSSREFDLCRRLAMATDRLVFVLTYELWPIHKTKAGDVTEGFVWVGPDGASDDMASWGWCRRCSEFVLGAWGLHHPGGDHPVHDEVGLSPTRHPDILRAYEIARGKRFDKVAA